jgi:hypothetical protein
MKIQLRLMTLAAFVVASGATFAQTDGHHPDADAPQAPLAAPGAWWSSGSRATAQSAPTKNIPHQDNSGRSSNHEPAGSISSRSFGRARTEA